MPSSYIFDKNCEAILNIVSNNFLYPCINKDIRE